MKRRDDAPKKSKKKTREPDEEAAAGVPGVSLYGPGPYRMVGCVFDSSGIALGAEDADVELHNPVFLGNEMDIDSTRSQFDIEEGHFVSPSKDKPARRGRNKGFSGNLPEMPWKKKKKKQQPKGEPPPPNRR